MILQTYVALVTTWLTDDQHLRSFKKLFLVDRWLSDDQLTTLENTFFCCWSLAKQHPIHWLFFQKNGRFGLWQKRQSIHWRSLPKIFLIAGRRLKLRPSIIKDSSKVHTGKLFSASAPRLCPSQARPLREPTSRWEPWFEALLQTRTSGLVAGFYKRGT